MLFARRKPPIDDETAEWIGDCFGWLLANRGGRSAFQQVPLVLPTKVFFTRNGTTGHALAEHIFDQVRHHAGLSDWPCRLAPQMQTPNRQVGEFWTVQGGPTAPAGTYRKSPRSNTPTVTYDPGLLGDPIGLIATFAHELAHYLIDTISEPPPGGEEMLEFATDVAAVYMGFGIFATNASYRFTQFGDAFAQGYLSGRELAYGLALFVRLGGRSDSDAAGHLSPDFRTAFKKALRHLDRNPQVISKIEDQAHRRAA